MNALLRWLDDRTGLNACLRDCCDTTLPASVRWERVWPSTIVFTFVVEAITGIVLWMFYSPSAQSAWESVYWIQHEVFGGWLVRGLHYWAGQALLALLILYILQMIVVGSYRAPREFVFWVAVLLAVFTLGLLLTGDLLAWTQRGYWSTQVRTSFLTLVPWVGGELYKIGVGGTAFGHLTLTRFFALHGGVLAVAFGLLLVLNHKLLRRADRIQLAGQAPAANYWPCQAVLNMAACLVVLAAMVLLTVYPAWIGDHSGQRPGEYLGVELGAPADPVDAYAAARPDWYFVGLYQLASMIPANPLGPTNMKFIPIFVVPGLIVVVLLAMPLVVKIRGGYAFNLLVSVAGLAAIGVLSWMAVKHDLESQGHQIALAEGLADAERVKELAQSPTGIPVTGALTLLRNDPKTQGLKLFVQHCASCHEHSSPEGEGLTTEKPSAPNLFRFASRGWLEGLFDPNQIGGPRYFGNTENFKNGKMADFVKKLPKMHEDIGMSKEELKAEVVKMIDALTAESQLTGPLNIPEKPSEALEAKLELLDGLTCLDCHRFYNRGSLGGAPDLTGYGSREWVIGIISNPAHQRFYGKRNERMPAYAKDPNKPENNILSTRQIEILADWLASRWYEPKP